MPSFTDIEIQFDFTDSDGNVRTEFETFDCEDSSLQSTVEDRRDELLDDLNADGEEEGVEWESDGFEVHDYDTDFNDPKEFDDLDDYGEYAELVVDLGFAYHLYYNDCGECTKSEFEDRYCGEWDSFQEYAEQLIDDCYDIPDHLASYIDYEKWARDLSYDYIELEDEDGQVHVFRNC